MLSKLTKKYSEFINFPIFLKSKKEVSKEVPIEDEAPKTEEKPDEKKDDERVLEEGDKKAEEKPKDAEKKDEDITVKDGDSEEPKDDKPKTKTVRETVWSWERVNDVKAIWYRSKGDI